MRSVAERASGPPPSFEDAANLRQRTRASGLDPEHWYVVARVDGFARGTVEHVAFWGTDVALWRGTDGVFRAAEDRCAHRHLPLTEGHVVDCSWPAATTGGATTARQVVDIPHELFGTSPRFRVGAYPVSERYGLIFVFPGDRARDRGGRDIPLIPELEGERRGLHADAVRLPRAPLDAARQRLGLHPRVPAPASTSRSAAPSCSRCEEIGDRVELEYKSRIAAGRLQNMFIDRSQSDCDSHARRYDYPYHWSNTDGRIKHFLFTLPDDDSHNRHIFIFYRQDHHQAAAPRPAARLVDGEQMDRRSAGYVQPLLGQDVWVIEHEQAAWERHWDRAVARAHARS